jgi:uncharacterized membrane protein YcaP (DUF421 family)
MKMIPYASVKVYRSMNKKHIKQLTYTDDINGIRLGEISPDP